MKFRPAKCSRPAAEQRYIMARLALWPELPFSEKDRISQFIQDITGDPAHGRALFGVLVAGKTPAQMAEKTGVAVGAIHKQRRAFLERFPIGEA